MKQIPDDFDLFYGASLIPNGGETSEFYFDDEPLERILYGAVSSGPSAANLFGPALKYVNDIIDACNRADVAIVIGLSARLGESDVSLSGEMCYRLAAAIASFFPYYPNPVMKHDLRLLKPLFEKMWAIALEKKDLKLQEAAGIPLFRWYEHHGKYEEARQVLLRLIEISRAHGNRGTEGIYLNNLGFEYMLEERWKEAITYFEEAARIFKEENILFEEINARANYLLCRFELNDLDDMEAIEAEVKEIMTCFNGAGRWYERKPLILLAKIEERRGNREKAVGLVKRAIESASGSNTMYPEIDGEYLNYLQAKKKGKS